ncbi:hypothetical protein [Fusobacterium necrophorum]|uniref:hypothetical protein n=1 Tax=Fusobacterium necrophorum TaxID=859 RepID=UPI0009BE3737|nr:hypothetical protein [Fusobacterium necrophorum]MDK4522074.1 hypothetical protein [Fusobacterium necrophorum]
MIQKLNKTDNINLSNLFVFGDQVCFPKTKEKGFLSAKYCPNLWALGANSTNNNKLSTQIVNNIITCANVYNLSQKSTINSDSENNIYLKAYFELSSYLRYLFIYYNSFISDEELKEVSAKLPLILYIKSSIDAGEQVNIITYNYDIWLERLLQLNDLDFSINGFETSKKLIDIYKPHGSISFSFKTKVNDSAPYKIKIATDDIAQETKDFDVVYNFENDYPIVNSLIPPSGDSNRFPYGWIGKIRENLSSCIKASKSGDELIIIGISYWHVDRNEIDDILININPNIDLKYVNPYPPADFNAVLSSLFKNYIHYKSGDFII